MNSKIKVIMYNIHTRDEIVATLLGTTIVNGRMFYTVGWFGTQETVSSFQGWTIKEELS